MPVNAHPDYIAAEKVYLQAKTLEEKLTALEDMIRKAPKHKSSENLLAQLRLRYKKLQQQLEKTKKSRKGKPGIKKEDMQAVIVGFTNSGKSSLLSILTNAKPEISEFEFTTQNPAIGMMSYQGASIQIIEIPAIESKDYDKGIVYGTDTLLILINNLEDIKKIEPFLRSPAKKIIVFNNKDKSESELRKIDATLKSKKHNYVIISTKDQEGLEELKEKIFKSFGKIRVFTKEPGKEKSPKPVILSPGSSVKNIAEKILKGFTKNVKETRIWGPSSKFSGQKVGLNHVLKDLDVIEFKTR